VRILAYLYYPFFSQHLAGGVQVSVRTLVRGFLERGHQVRVLCPGNDSRPLFESPGLDLRPVLVEQRAATIRCEDVRHNLREIRRALETVDVVWTVDRLFPLDTPQPTVLSLSALCYANELDALFGLNWDHLVVPSSYVAGVIDSWLHLDLLGSSSRCCSSIAPPLDPIFHPSSDVSRMRSKLGLRRDERCLLFPHRPESDKGHELALRVLQELLSHDRRFHLLVPKPPTSLCLDAPAEAAWIEHVRSEVVRLELQDRVTFHDWIDYADLPEYYSLGECCLCLSTLPETFGMSVVQSIASGTFVVSSGTGALTEAVPSGDAHRVVPDLDPAAVARAVLEGCSDEGLRRARAWIFDKYPPERSIDAYLDCFSATAKLTASSGAGRDRRLHERLIIPPSQRMLTDDSETGASDPEGGVTVVTITRRRPQLLARCMQSIAAQTYQGVLKHLIIVDDCADTIAFLARAQNANHRIHSVLSERRVGESSGPPRLARLRNQAVTLVDTRWIAFLDDDNEYEPSHIDSLVTCAAASRCPAVHSYRQLLYFEGGAYLEPRWPWCRDLKAAEDCYRGLVQHGVLEEGSNVVRDRIDLTPGSRIVMVDTNEWLIRADVLRKIKISDDFSYQDWLDNIAEDEKLIDALLAAHVPIACSGRATVKYYLGGYSNDLNHEYSHSERWIFNGHGS